MILVTGASGNVGKEVVEVLRRRDLGFRVGARKANPSSSVGQDEIVRFDFLDPSTYGSAARGCDAVFLLRPPSVANTRETLNVFLDVARREGVRHVVFISVAGAADNPMVPHHAVEQHLKAGPRGWTVLRPGFFAQNLGDAYLDDIVRDNRIYVPAGQGRVAFVDVRDIAEIAVNALVDPVTHGGQVYTLPGPEALTFEEVATIVSEELGRSVRYEPASVVGYMWHMRRRGVGPAQLLVQTILHVGLRFGQADNAGDMLARLLGHPARTMRDYVRDCRGAFEAAVVAGK